MAKEQFEPFRPISYTGTDYDIGDFVDERGVDKKRGKKTPKPPKKPKK